MNLIQSIDNGNFIKDLEELLTKEEGNGKKNTFEQFSSQLWYFLSALSTRRKTKLEKEMQIRGKYYYNGNIGNIRLEIINSLGISFMLND